MSRCKCGKEWGDKEKAEMPGTADKPVPGFHFKFKAGTKLAAQDEKGNPIHPFDRPEMEIVSCPHCRKSMASLVASELGARTIVSTEDGQLNVETLENDDGTTKTDRTRLVERCFNENL